MKCDLHGKRIPRKAFETALVCSRCGAPIPASAAVTFEGSDYVRHFCGSDCLADWCENKVVRKC